MNIIKKRKSKIVLSVFLISFFTIFFETRVNQLSVQAEGPATGGVGFTIQETFPDHNLAQGVADKVSAGNVDAVLTQGMIDGLMDLEIIVSQITDLTGIGYLTELRTLDLWGNQLTSLPIEIGNLGKLQYLGLGNNRLTSVPNEIGILSNLRTLDLGNNQLTQLPIEVYDLTALKTFIASGNQLTTLPKEINQLLLLEVLNLNDNQLFSVPNEIGNLVYLKEVYLANNQLTIIPEEISNLNLLEFLSISNNQLTSLPNAIGNLNALQMIDLYGNLLPTNYASILNTLGLNFVVAYEPQRQLTRKTGILPYIIKMENDLENIDLFAIVELDDASSIAGSHELIVENYVDENNNPVNIGDYLQNGKVVKEGKVFAQVRATGVGLFPNNSDHAVTLEKIQFNFERTYFNLFFDLNGGISETPVVQVLAEGASSMAVTEPTRENHTFKGWNTKRDGSGAIWNFETSTMPSNNVTLYAQWGIQATPIILGTSNAPKTGDSGNLLGLNLLLLSASGLLIGSVKRRKNKPLL